jgi:hypothetical protein
MKLYSMLKAYVILAPLAITVYAPTVAATPLGVEKSRKWIRIPKIAKTSYISFEVAAQICVSD